MSKRPTTTKSRILQAARTLFSTHGYENTTIDDIITASGVTKGAFYHYFKSKESLCATVIEHLKSDYQQIINSLPAELEPIGTLRKLLNKLAELNASGQWVNCRLILRLTIEPHQEHPELQQKICDFWQWYIGFYEKLIGQCRSVGQIKTYIGPKAQTRLLLALMAGTIMLEKIDPSAKPFADVTKTIIRALQS